MDLHRPAYLGTTVLSIIAVYVGMRNVRADLLIPGILSAVLSVIMLYQSFRGKHITVWIPLLLDLFLLIGILNVAVTDFTEFAQLALATPLFVALGACVLCSMIAYSSVRLDGLMFNVYFLFLTLAISNVFSYGVYYYTLKYGVEDELLANFWLVDEFAFAFVFCVVALFIVRMYLKKKNIRLITANDLLDSITDEEVA